MEGERQRLIEQRGEERRRANQLSAALKVYLSPEHETFVALCFDGSLSLVGTRAEVDEFCENYAQQNGPNRLFVFDASHQPIWFLSRLQSDPEFVRGLVDQRLLAHPNLEALKIRFQNLSQGLILSHMVKWGPESLATLVELDKGGGAKSSEIKQF